MLKSKECLIQITDLSYATDGKAIFNNLNIDIQLGKITAIMGPSGIGKTTLLRLIGGQLKPKSGVISFDGININELRRSELVNLRKRMGMLFQSGALFSELTVFENVAFALREHTNLPKDIIDAIVLMKLEAVGLRGASELMPSQLSGGMARRAALARAMALDPDLIMFDEPFVGQDPITMGVLVELIKKINTALGITCIVVSHDVPEVLSIADYAYIIADKRVIAEGTPHELKNENDPQVRQFLDGLADGPVPFNYPASPYEDAFINVRL
ncbi:phospholipid ABC transporter ATP-binding protein MlaF [Thorsellia kenyensis]|uniref:Phospholipid ABC transporter ATP-binding protein MlaF n=1 Tax=Thorsellia kenyensis TaxID=1549888 RepID=A0ABV6C8S9_9GAMM